MDVGRKESVVVKVLDSELKGSVFEPNVLRYL